MSRQTQCRVLVQASIGTGPSQGYTYVIFDPYTWIQQESLLVESWKLVRTIHSKLARLPKVKYTTQSSPDAMPLYTFPFGANCKAQIMSAVCWVNGAWCAFFFTSFPIFLFLLLEWPRCGYCPTKHGIKIHWTPRSTPILFVFSSEVQVLDLVTHEHLHSTLYFLLRHAAIKQEVETGNGSKLRSKMFQPDHYNFQETKTWVYMQI